MQTKPGQHYVKTRGSEDIDIYFPVSWDRALEERELLKKPLTGIFVGDLSSEWMSSIALIMVEELDGHAQRLDIGRDTARCRGWHEIQWYGINDIEIGKV